jgi:hypothetical protein
MTVFYFNKPTNVNDNDEALLDILAPKCVSIFQHIVGIPMETNCAPLFTLFCTQKLLICLPNGFSNIFKQKISI